MEIITNAPTAGISQHATVAVGRSPGRANTAGQSDAKAAASRADQIDLLGLDSVSEAFKRLSQTEALLTIPEPVNRAIKQLAREVFTGLANGNFVH